MTIGALSSLLMLIVAGLPMARADTVHLRSGEKVVGEIVTDERTRVVIKSQALGRLEIPRDHIDRIELGTATEQSPKPVVMATNLPPAGTAVTKVPAAKSGLWRPKPPKDDAKADWIQLKSGEWLRGKLHGMQNRKVEFESDELDDLEFDWKDVHQVQMPEALVAYGDNESTWGSVQIDREHVTVTGAKTVRFARYDLVGLAPGSPRERDYWSGRFNVGLNLRSGNTRQADMVTKFTLERRTPKTHLELDYLGNFSELDGVESVNNHRTSLYFDYFLTRRFFLRVPQSEYYRDPFQNIDKRLTVGAGVGYYLVDRSKVEWLITGGPAYQYTRFDTVELGDEPDTYTPAIYLQSNLEIELSKRVDLDLGYQGTVANEASGSLIQHGTITFEIDLTQRLDLDISLIWDRIENPQTDSSGVEPEKNDFRLNMALGVKF